MELVLNYSWAGTGTSDEAQPCRERLGHQPHAVPPQPAGGDSLSPGQQAGPGPPKVPVVTGCSPGTCMSLSVPAGPRFPSPRSIRHHSCGPDSVPSLASSRPDQLQLCGSDILCPPQICAMRRRCRCPGLPGGVREMLVLHVSVARLPQGHSSGDRAQGPVSSGYRSPGPGGSLWLHHTAPCPPAGQLGDKGTRDSGWGQWERTPGHSRFTLGLTLQTRPDWTGPFTKLCHGLHSLSQCPCSAPSKSQGWQLSSRSPRKTWNQIRAQAPAARGALSPLTFLV